MLVHLDPTLVDLVIDGETVETTPEHPFYIEQYGWLDAGLLWQGAQIRRADGTDGMVEAVKVVQRSQTMYNLTVDVAHTFFVGDKHWLVHNTTKKCSDPITYYHATTKESAANIQKRGIDPSLGRPDLDFNPSTKGGFYVTTEYSQAKAWAAKNGSNGAIVEFEVSESQLRSLNGKIFTLPNDEWEQFVTNGRYGKLQHNYDYVEGSMWLNPYKFPVKSGGQQLAMFNNTVSKLFKLVRIINL